MKTLLTTALAAVAFAATPALAQTNQGGSTAGETQATQPQGQGNQSAQGGSSTQGMSAEGTPGGMTGEQMAVSQQRVIETLSAAGLTDVQIMDAAYLVQATTPDDEEVMMIVNSSGQPMSPPQMGQAGSAPSGQGMGQPRQGMSEQQGTGQQQGEAQTGSESSSN